LTYSVFANHRKPLNDPRRALTVLRRADQGLPAQAAAPVRSWLAAKPG
jgi:hypothetical protein